MSEQKPAKLRMPPGCRAVESETIVAFIPAQRPATKESPEAKRTVRAVMRRRLRLAEAEAIRDLWQAGT